MVPVYGSIWGTKTKTTTTEEGRNMRNHLLFLLFLLLLLLLLLPSLAFEPRSFPYFFRRKRGKKRESIKSNIFGIVSFVAAAAGFWRSAKEDSSSSCTSFFVFFLPKNVGTSEMRFLLGSPGIFFKGKGMPNANSTKEKHRSESINATFDMFCFPT